MKLSYSLDKVTKPIIKQNGIYDTKLLAEWQNIVGSDVASYTMPYKIAVQKSAKGQEKILFLYVYNSALATKLSFLHDIIVEKISAYLGYKLVSKIKLVQKPPYNNADYMRDIYEPEISPERKLCLQKMTDLIQDNELNEALFKLGRYII
jgi:hypothetical protein